MTVLEDAQILWEYHQLHHEFHDTDIAIGLGSHDIGVAEHAAELWHEGLFPLIVFTGANAPTTVSVFPRGEAVHYAERAQELGVPAEAILTETRATNTGETSPARARYSKTAESKHVQRQSSAAPTNSAEPLRQRRKYGRNSK